MRNILVLIMLFNIAYAVTNGRYVGSLLLCNDGYKDVGGQCSKLP